MPTSQYERWLELIAMVDKPSRHWICRKVYLPPEYNDQCKQWADDFGFTVTSLLRVFVIVGIRALQAADLDDKQRRAQYYLRQLLDNADSLTPNDRRYAREQLMSESRTMNSTPPSAKDAEQP